MRRITAATLTLTFTLTVLVFTAGPSTATPGPMVCPVPSATFVDSWGAPRDGGARSHQGVDMMAPDGDPIYAPETGTYRTHGNDSFYLDGVSGATYFGTHLQEHVRGDGPVTAGEVVALVGHTGNASASAPHLHFEIHPGGGPAVNPTPATFAACTGPDPAEVAVANAVRFVAAVGGPINWPYTSREAKRLWNAFHPDAPIVKPVSTRLAAFLNAIVEQRLRAYALALYVSRLQPSSCTGPSDCGPMIASIFERLGLSGSQAVAVARCESGLNPNASNGGNFLGLFQHARVYWAGRAAQYGMAGASVFDGYANAYVSARMVRDGGWGPWQCRA